MPKAEKKWRRGRLPHNPLPENIETLPPKKQAQLLVGHSVKDPKTHKQVITLSIPKNRVSVYVNGAGDIVGYGYSHEGKVWQLPNIAPIKQREEIYTEASFKHPAKMPTIWAQHMIQNYTSPGDWILDPMAGEGTTNIEASRLGRNSIAIDIDAGCVRRMEKNSELLQKSGQAKGEIKVFKADAREMPSLGRQVDAIIFSPPYGGMVGAHHHGVKYGNNKPREYDVHWKGKAQLMGGGANFEQDMTQVFKECHKALKPSGLMVFNVKHQVSYKEAKLIHTDEQLQRCAEAAGFKRVARKRIAVPNVSHDRRINEKHYPNAPKLRHEEVLLFKK